MGISLKDLGNIAIGAIERDRELTADSAKTRQDELIANRNLILKMKEKKYDSDIKRFEAEQKKFDAVKSVKNFLPEGATDVDFGKAYLKETNPDMYYKLMKDYQNNPNALDNEFRSYYSDNLKNFKVSKTQDEIDNSLAEEVKAITADYSKKINNAKGDSFLIGELLGKRNKEIKKVTEENDISSEGAKAAEVVTQETLTQDDKDINIIKTEKKEESLFIDKTSDAYKNFRTNNTKYASDLRKANSNKNSADNQLTIAQSFRQLGIANIGDYFETNNEGGIKAFKKGGENFADTIFSQWKMYKDYKINPGTDNLYLGLNKDSVNLVPYYDKENANGEIANRTKEFAVPVAKGNIAGEGGAFNFSNILRNKKDNLIVVPTANSIDFDGTIVGSDIRLTNSEDKVIAKKLYAQALINNSKVNGEINIQKLKQNQDTLQNLEYGKSNALLEKINNDFINLYKGNTAATDDGTPPPNKDVGIIKITNPADGTFQIKKDTVANRNLAAQKAKELNVDISEILSEIKNIKQEPTAGDASIAETTMGVNDNVFGDKIKPEGELGDVNPKFTTLESVLKILPNSMTGKEIKEKYNIDFKINEKSLFRPLK